MAAVSASASLRGFCGRYLGDSQIEFDLVLFDEASQMRTEHAVGAMAMARQVAVASAMQLCPTSHCHIANLMLPDR